MELKTFRKMLEDKKYTDIEQTLKSEMMSSNDMHLKYLLGVCYSEQIEKIPDAITTFKELIKKDAKYPYIYDYVANRTNNVLEAIKIIQQGLKYSPKDKLLNKSLIFRLHGIEKENQFKFICEEHLLDGGVVLDMVEYYFNNRRFTDIVNLLELYDFKDDNVSSIDDIKFINILSRYMVKSQIDFDILNRLIISDIDKEYALIPKLIEINLVIDDDKNKAYKLIKELPYFVSGDPFIEIISFYDPPADFLIDDIQNEILSSLYSKIDDTDLKEKIILIQELSKMYNKDESKKISKTTLRKIEKMVKHQLSVLKRDELTQCLIDIYIELGENINAFKVFIENINFRSNDDLTIYIDEFSELDLKNIVQYACDNIKIHSYNQKRYKPIISDIISTLFKKKNYTDIIKLAESIDIKQMDYIDLGFELAYSYSQKGKLEVAQLIYEKYINKHPESDAAMNNLGVIYEKNGDLDNALKKYEEAENISHNEIYTNNIVRCKELIDERSESYKKFETGLKEIENENIWIIKKLKLFFDDADENGNVICSYNKLPKLLECDVNKSGELLDQFLKKNYVAKNKSHNYDTSSSVYAINTLVRDKILSMEKESQIINKFTDIFNNITLTKLREIDYIELKNKCSDIKNLDIKEILERDLDELVFAYLSFQQKTVILLCGTIIESILTYVIEKANIQKYKIGTKNKRLYDMDISEMLYVCTEEKLIDNTPEKFINGMKKFRNFVHPGRELEEKSLKINKNSVELAWETVKWLVMTINLN